MASISDQLFIFPDLVRRDPAVDAWFLTRAGGLGDIARIWFDIIRSCGDDVRELLHDGHPTAMPHSGTSMLSHHTLMWDSFAVLSLQIRAAFWKAPANSCGM
ncbi:MAG: hypothetical protein ABI539_03020 [Acidobacteriota bacterium]